jgi:hypothetical protein
MEISMIGFWLVVLLCGGVGAVFGWALRALLMDEEVERRVLAELEARDAEESLDAAVRHLPEDVEVLRQYKFATPVTLRAGDTMRVEDAVGDTPVARVTLVDGTKYDVPMHVVGERASPDWGTPADWKMQP